MSDSFRHIRDFRQLLSYLRRELDWPVADKDVLDVDDLTFDYTADELGLDPKTAAKIKQIKQLRPLTASQPWGIFYIQFEPKRLPVVALRRILSKLVLKRRASANKSERASWQLHDLLFISNYGEGESRQLDLAHFSESDSRPDLPTLKVLGWDGDDTALKLAHVENQLRAKLRWPDNPDDVSQWRKSWSAAFELRPREVITTAQALAAKLADLAKSIRKQAKQVLDVESDRGRCGSSSMPFAKRSFTIWTKTTSPTCMPRPSPMGCSPPPSRGRPRKGPDQSLYCDLASLGSELVSLHLLESPLLKKHRTKFKGKEGVVEKVTWSDETVWIDKEQTEGFVGVPQQVWEFHIGGYQVCQKWLKDRKGRTLSKEDIEHYHKIVVALGETIRLMGEIDAVIERHGGWPGAFAVGADSKSQI